VANLTVPSLHERGNGLFTPVAYGFHASNTRRPAMRDLFPRWGQELAAQYRHTPLRGDFELARFSASVAAYLPSAVRHHGFKAYAEVEDNRAEGAIRFSTTVSRPRGYDNLVIGSRMIGTKADYAFPVAYPDFKAGPLVFVPRITGAVFHDYFRASQGALTDDMWSAGVELFMETVPFGLGVALPFGARLAYRSADRRWVVQGAFRWY
jgi:hypothetical protein